MKGKFSALLVALMLSVTFTFSAPAAVAPGMTTQDFLTEARDNITTISLSEANDLFDQGGVIFLDVRSLQEREDWGYVPGSVHVRRGFLEFQIESKIPDKSVEIVVYCKTGGRSSLSSHTLVKMGYTNVKNMSGGFDAWFDADYPTEG